MVQAVTKGEVRARLRQTWLMGTRALRSDDEVDARREGQVVFVHGYLATRAVLHPLRDGVRRLGYATHELGYGPFANFDATAARLVDLIASLPTPMVLVGHSLGGLLCRAAVLRGDTSVRVNALITIATPHGGVRRARWLPGGVGIALRPGSPILRQLGRRVPVPLLNVLGQRDRLVTEESGSAVDADRTLRFPCDHNELLYDGDVQLEVLAQVERTLSEAS